MPYLLRIATGVYRHITNRPTQHRHYMVSGEAEQAWAWFGPSNVAECYEEA